MDCGASGARFRGKRLKNLLTDDDIAEIRANAVSCTVFEKERLLTHIAALKSDLELLIKVACREQRYKCSDWIENPCAPPDVIEKAQADAQNAPCPDTADVFQKWQKAKEAK